MTPATIEEDRLWAAIGEPSRRHLLDLLLEHGEATPTTLASELPFSRQAVAKHLTVLDGVGLVRARRQGREVRYTVQSERLAEAARVMLRVADDWDGRLNAIKTIAERLHREESHEQIG
jgi:ArsR family transcriptional regulator, cadmium/lead-responsive transcriptional repressor